MLLEGLLIPRKSLNPLTAVKEKGFYPLEDADTPSPFRWIGKEAELYFRAPAALGRKALIVKCGHPFSSENNPTLKVYLNKRQIAEKKVLSYKESQNNFVFPLDRANEKFHIKLSLDKTFLPALTGSDKEMGMMVKGIGLWAEKKAGHPSVLELESTTHCNINPPCVMCYPRILRDENEKEGYVDRQVLEGLKGHLGAFNNISLHGLGEPLIGDALDKILDGIDKGRTYIQFNSNGILLTEEKSRTLIVKGLRMINISLDAATKDTFRKIRRSDFDLVTGNVKRLSAIKKELSVSHPMIMINMTVMKENVDEMIAFVDLAKDLGAECVYYSVLNDHPHTGYQVTNDNFVFHYKDQMIDHASAEFTRRIEAVKDKARSHGIETRFALPERTVAVAAGDNGPGRAQNFYCSFPWEHAFIQANGDTRFCCHINYQEGKIGNLTEKSFDDIWHSERAQEIREAISGGKLHSACKLCPLYGHKEG